MLAKTFFLLLAVAAAQDTGTDDCDCCVDKHPQCPDWAAAGECDANAAWMWPNCPKSCNKCPHCPDCPCQDLHPQCPEWAALTPSECDVNAGWMWVNCPKSCDRCPHGDGCDKCLDKDPQCPAWAKDGECDINPDWMWVNCPKSCNKCPHCDHKSKVIMIKSCTGGVEWPDGTGLVFYFDAGESKAGKHMGGGDKNVIVKEAGCDGQCATQQWEVDCYCCGDECGAACSNGDCDCDCGCGCPTKIRWMQDKSQCIRANCDDNGCNAEIDTCSNCDCLTGKCPDCWILDGEKGKDWHTKIKMASNDQKCLFWHSSIQSDTTSNVYMDDCGKMEGPGYGKKNGEMFHPIEQNFAIEEVNPLQ